MKKFILLMLTLVMVFALSACGDDKGGDAKKDDAIKVGFIFIGPVNDGGFSEAQNQGRLALEEQFKGEVETAYVEGVSEKKQDVKNAAINLMDQGCNVIVGCSYGYMDTLEELSKEYGDVKFLHFSGNKMNDTNFANHFGAMEEPRYLTGVLAGLTTKSNKIGYVAAFPYTEVQIGINAFALGVQSVNKDAVVKVVYINSWHDPANEKAAAEALLAQGCDVMAQHCDSMGPVTAAQKKGAYAIGYNLDKKDKAPDTFLTAPIWHHEVYFKKVIDSMKNDEFKPESYYGNMKDGYIGLSEINDKIVSKDVIDKVKAVEEKILNGELKPFSGKIEYSDGKILCKEGQTLTRDEIWQINGVIKGVEAVENK